MTAIQIGTFNLTRAETYANTFECAAWNENVAVQPGRFPIMAEIDRATGRVKDTSVCVRLEGAIESDYFQSLYAGSPIGKTYDQKQNAGKSAHHFLRPYAHALAKMMLEVGAPSWELEGFEAREIHFEYDGQARVTYGIERIEA